MGETSSTLNRIRKLKNRTQNGFSCFMPRRNFNVQPKVLVFAQCKTDFSWNCVLILLELYGSHIRLHATTDDYDNIKKIGDKNILKYLNKLLFVHKIDLSSEVSTDETWNEIVKMEGRVDVLGELTVLFSYSITRIFLYESPCKKLKSQIAKT